MFFCFTLFLVSCAEDKSYVLVFDTNEGIQIDSIEFNEIDEIVMPSHPTRVGYVFDGWYFDDETFLNPFVGSLDLSEGVTSFTLYAKWTQNHIFSHLLNDGDYVTNYADNLHSLILEVNIIYNDLDELKYIVISTYSQFDFGIASIYMIINDVGEIEEIDFIEYSSTYQIDSINSYLQSYQGLLASNVRMKLDLTSGATISYDLIREHLTAMQDTYHQVLDSLIPSHDGWMGTNYYVYDDNDFVATSHIVSRKIVKTIEENIVGYVYQLQGSGVYNVEMFVEGTINIYVGVLFDQTVFAYDLPIDEYGHTKGFYYNKTKMYLDTLVSQNISSFMQSSDIISGPSRSIELVDFLLNQLNEHLLNS
jgi:uncharacterized repeat protein (TIGR02543 family)